MWSEWIKMDDLIYKEWNENYTNVSADEQRVSKWWVIIWAIPVKPIPDPPIFMTHSSAPLVLILISLPIET